MDFSAIKTLIEQNIRTNNNEDITGSVLQNVLLGIIETLGDDAINDLITALGQEVTNRQNAVQGEADARVAAINNVLELLRDEVQARQDADAAEHQRAEAAFDDLDMIDAAGVDVRQESINLTLRKNDGSDEDPEWRTLCSILLPSVSYDRAGLMSVDLRNKLLYLMNGGYLFQGVAVPASNPGTPHASCFYLATKSGTYTNFHNADDDPIVIEHDAIYVLTYDAVENSYWEWNKVTDFGDGVFDISMYNLTEGQPTAYADLSAALGTNGANVPAAFRKGGMSIKFVHSSDNNYVQFRYMGTSTANADFANVANWQGVDGTPSRFSNNLMESGGVFDTTNVLNRIILPTITKDNMEVLLGKRINGYTKQIDSSAWGNVYYIKNNNYKKIEVNTQHDGRYVAIAFYNAEELVRSNCIASVIIDSSEPTTNHLYTATIPEEAVMIACTLRTNGHATLDGEVSGQYINIYNTDKSDLNKKFENIIKIESDMYDGNLADLCTLYDNIDYDGEGNILLVSNHALCRTELPKGNYSIKVTDDTITSIKIIGYPFTLIHNFATEYNFTLGSDSYIGIILKKNSNADVSKTLSELFVLSKHINNDKYSTITPTFVGGKDMDGGGNIYDNTTLNHWAPQRLTGEIGDRFLVVLNGQYRVKLNVYDKLKDGRSNFDTIASSFGYTIQKEGDFLQFVIMSYSDGNPITSASNIDVTVYHFSSRINEDYDMVFAASDTPKELLGFADIQLDGVNDSKLICAAVNLSYTNNVKIKLLDGNYYFNYIYKIASNNILSPQDGCVISYAFLRSAGNPYPKDLIIEGNRYITKRDGIGSSVSANNNYIDGAAIIVPADFYNSELTSPCALIEVLGWKYSSNLLINPAVGAFPGTSMAIRNVRFRIFQEQKPIIAIDGSCCGGSFQCESVSVYFGQKETIENFTPSTPIPIEGVIGIRGGVGSCYGTQNFIKNCVVHRAYKGFDIAGEHFIMSDCKAHHCYIGFAFGDFANRSKTEHPNIMIGCSMEQCLHFMRLSKYGATNDEEWSQLAALYLEQTGKTLSKAKQTIVIIGMSTEPYFGTNSIPGYEDGVHPTGGIIDSVTNAYRGRVESDWRSNSVFATGGDNFEKTIYL